MKIMEWPSVPRGQICKPSNAFFSRDFLGCTFSTLYNGVVKSQECIAADDNCCFFVSNKLSQEQT